MKTNKFDTDSAILFLINSISGLKENWENYIDKEYKNYPSERNDYIDIAEISRNICDWIITKQTDDFNTFFDNLS